jgi:hypothetical protein
VTSVFLLDRLLSIGTGRPVTFLDCHIEIAEPEVDQAVLVETSPGRPSSAFAYTVRLTKLYGSIAQSVNPSRYWLPGLTGEVNSGIMTASESHTAHQTTAPQKKWQDLVTEPDFANELSTLVEIETDMVSLYESLPASLVWSTNK